MIHFSHVTSPYYSFMYLEYVLVFLPIFLMDANNPGVNSDPVRHTHTLLQTFGFTPFLSTHHELWLAIADVTSAPFFPARLHDAVYCFTTCLLRFAALP